MTWKAPASAVIRNTVLVPAELLRKTLEQGGPLEVDLVTQQKRRVRLILRPDWPLRFHVPARDAVQFHFTANDITEDASDPVLPPWPTLTPPPFDDAGIETLVRMCWLSAQMTAEALALEACTARTTKHQRFLTHYFASPRQRAKAAQVDATWVVFCGAVDSVALDPRPGFTDKLASFVNVGSTRRVFEGGLATRSGELWSRAGRWMAQQISTRTPLEACAAVAASDLPDNWMSDPLLLLGAGLCPHGDAVAPDVARAQLWPYAVYDARRRLFMRVVERLQVTPFPQWPEGVRRLWQLAAKDLPPSIPSRADECAALALKCAAVTNAKLADPDALKAMLTQRARQVAYRANAAWSAPLVAARDARYAGLRARFPTPHFSSVLTLPGLPPCLLNGVLAARASHRIADKDRLTFASWIVALEPRDSDASTLESALDIARFMLDETDATERVRGFASVITTARKRHRSTQRDDDDISRVTGCKKIIERTAKNEPTTIRCHFQGTYPDSTFDCQKHCSQGKKGLCHTPLDHLLSLLDW